MSMNEEENNEPRYTPRAHIMPSPSSHKQKKNINQLPLFEYQDKMHNDFVRRT